MGRKSQPRMPKQPAADKLLLQLIRLQLAKFDMRCAIEVSFDLEKTPDDDIGPRAYGLYAGLAVSYARPFVAGEGSPYGPLDAKWSKFADRPELRPLHEKLLLDRRTLLAHNDRTIHRTALVWPRFNEGRPMMVEGRSPLQAPGTAAARDLASFQRDRFGEHAQTLAERLQDALGWVEGVEIDLHVELERVRGLGTE
jgi:hypothetical protein